jgi:hypothetical protein
VALAVIHLAHRLQQAVIILLSALSLAQVVVAVDLRLLNRALMVALVVGALMGTQPRQVELEILLLLARLKEITAGQETVTVSIILLAAVAAELVQQDKMRLLQLLLVMAAMVLPQVFLVLQ